MADEHMAGAPDKASKGFLARAIGVFVSPGETFADVARRPTFLLPLLLTMAVMAGAGYLAAPIAAPEQADALASSKLFQHIPEERRAEALEGARHPSSRQIAFGIAMQSAGTGVAIAFYALLLWGAGHLLGGEPSFKGTLGALSFASLISPTASALVRLPLMFARHTVMGITLSPAILMHDVPYTDHTYLFLATFFDLFSLWGWFVAAVGIARVAGISTGKGVAAVAVIYLVRCALLFGLATLFT
jgi:hypothetical protein